MSDNYFFDYYQLVLNQIISGQTQLDQHQTDARAENYQLLSRAVSLNSRGGKRVICLTAGQLLYYFFVTPVGDLPESLSRGDGRKLSASRVGSSWGWLWQNFDSSARSLYPRTLDEGATGFVPFVPVKQLHLALPFP